MEWNLKSVAALGIITALAVMVPVIVVIVSVTATRLLWDVVIHHTTPLQGIIIGLFWIFCAFFTLFCCVVIVDEVRTIWRFIRHAR